MTADIEAWKFLLLNGVFTGAGTAIGIFLSNRLILKHMEKIIKKTKKLTRRK